MEHISTYEPYKNKYFDLHEDGNLIFVNNGNQLLGSGGMIEDDEWHLWYHPMARGSHP
jgi:hypothetical protein